MNREIEFINDCDCIVDYDELEKAIIWYRERPTRKLKHIYIHAKYPAVSIFNKKMHIHRLLMMYWNNDRNLSSKIYVHHKDENKLNSSRENLMFMEAKKHQSKHNKGKNISESQKKILISNNYKRKGVKKGIVKKGITYKKIWKLYLKGYSINKISKELNYDWGQIKIRLQEIHDNPELLGGGK